MTAIEFVIAVAIVLFAGGFRGVTGFGGAMMMAPPLAMLAGPVAAVVVSLILETSAAFVMLADAVPRARLKVLAYLIAPTILTVPLGSYLLITLDPVLARKAIAAVVVISSAILMFGFRYTGQQRTSTSLILGAIVGVLLGATSVGAPPIILYLLSGPDPVIVTRANLTILVTTLSIIGLAMLAVAGAITVKLASLSGLLIPAYLLAIWFGGKLFVRMNEVTARRVALGLMMMTGIVVFII